MQCSDELHALAAVPARSPKNARAAHRGVSNNSRKCRHDDIDKCVSSASICRWRALTSTHEIQSTKSSTAESSIFISQMADSILKRITVIHRLYDTCDSSSIATSSLLHNSSTQTVVINCSPIDAVRVPYRLPTTAIAARLFLILLLFGSAFASPVRASPILNNTFHSSSSSSSSSSLSSVKYNKTLLYSPGIPASLFFDYNNSASAGRETELWAVELHTEDETEAAEIAKRHGFVYHGKILSRIYHFKKPRLSKRSAGLEFVKADLTLQKDPHVKWLRQQRSKVRVKRSVVPESPPFSLPSFTLDDPKWPKMWYLNRDKLNMNVKPAWLKGYAGQGVVVSILDDGLERDHPDLRANYDPLASYDVLNNDPDPQPRYEPQDENKHGTRCAGEVASVANNSECSVGVAFMSKVGGIRMIDGEVTDSIEAAGLGRNIHHIDIFSVSWGPTDDGKTMEGPGELAQKAFYTGITQGRGGLGSIYIWASGNGGRYFDNCNCDGYANSIYTLTVSSVTENGGVPWYAESCPAILAVTYSSGDSRQRAVVTTDLHHGCTENHTGTSASAPLAAGIVALALSANRRLTWRDMQHIVIRTARHDVLGSMTGNGNEWRKNGLGRPVSHYFGYGLMDAAAMVELAKNWTTVPTQHICEVAAPMSGGPVTILHQNTASIRLVTNACVTEPGKHIRYLEHVQAKVSLRTTHRGKLEIYLRSPAGTLSKLLGRRSLDFNAEGFHRWPFMSVHNWGERPNGTWTLTVLAHESKVSVDEWSMVFYGTATDPTNPDDIDDEAVTPANKGPIGCGRVLKSDWSICLGWSLFVSIVLLLRNR